MFANSFAAIAVFLALANGLPLPQDSTPTSSSVPLSTSSSSPTSSAFSSVASVAVSSYNWNDGFTPSITVRASCNATNSNILSRALSDAIDVAQHARLHLLRYGNSSDIFPRYFGNASAAAEPLGWYDLLANGDKSGLVLRCDDVDDRCNDTATGIYTYRNNENVICPKAFANKLYNSDICAHGYTVAGNNATDTWAGAILGQLLSSERIGQGAISNKAESYASVIALAKNNFAVALHNAASLQYFALHAWAYDIAVPGAGCTGKYTNATLTTNSTLASNSTASTNTTVSSNSTSSAAQTQTVSSSASASATQSILLVTGSSVSATGSTRTVTSLATVSGSSAVSTVSASPSATLSSLSATASGASGSGSNRSSGVTRTVTESVTTPASSSASVTQTVTESVTATPSSSLSSVTRTVTESVVQTSSAVESASSSSASRRTVVVTEIQSSS